MAGSSLATIATTVTVATIATTEIIATIATRVTIATTVTIETTVTKARQHYKLSIAIIIATSNPEFVLLVGKTDF